MACIAWIEDDLERKFGPFIRLLEKDSHEILPCASWQEVEEQLDAICTCEAVILDVMLPWIEDDPYLGLSVLTMLRQRGYEGPIVVCTQVKNPAVLFDLDRFGATEILHKPIRPSVLRKAVAKALKGD